MGQGELEALFQQLTGGSGSVINEPAPMPAPVATTLMAHRTVDVEGVEWLCLDFQDCTGSKYVYYQPEKLLEILEKLDELARQMISGIIVAKELPRSE
jgi:hypothetical protein